MNRFLPGLLLFLTALGPLATQAETRPTQFPGQSGGNSQFLPVDEAYVLSVESPGENAVRVRFDIADEYYLYREKFEFRLTGAPDGVRLGEARFPAGKLHHDEYFGESEVYYDAVEILLPVEGAAPGRELSLSTTFQGCAEAGLCYPPTTRESPVRMGSGTVPLDTPATATEAGSSGSGIPAKSEQGRLADTIMTGNIALVMATFFGLGLLLTFTPCVWPMIPILSTIIAGQGESVTPRKAFFLSLVYVLAMAVTYTVAGVLFGLLGENIQAAFQNPWIIGVFVAVFVLLSLSMFGFYELQMPAAVQAKLRQVSHRQEGGTVIGVGIMGFLSALIVGPCITAPLVGALIVIGEMASPVRGGLALFGMSLGMGVPLLIIGTSLGKLVPRAGSWMNAVKAGFGVLLLGVAIWFLERVAPGSVTLFLWGLLATMSGVYLLGNRTTGGWQRFWQGLGLVAVIYGALMLIGAAGGQRDPLQPLAGLSGPAATGGASGTADARTKPAFQPVESLDELEAALDSAARSGRPVMLDFYADWCVDCQTYEHEIFPDPAVREVLERGALLQADVTEMAPRHKALMKEYGVVGPPSLLFFDTDGREMRDYRIVGAMSADRFRQHVATAFREATEQ